MLAERPRGGSADARAPASTERPRGGSADARAPASTEPRIADVAIRGVGKTFRRGGRRTVALADVSLDVRAGELVCLLGPSGCGKSTLLRIVAGALVPDEGTVTVAGQPVDGPSADRGMLFQSPMLFPWLTTRKNVLFGPLAQRSRGLHERDDPELEAEADAILDTVGLGGFGDAFPHELSGGMRHRAAFARALVTRPSLLLMDEPFGALDAITRLRMHDFLLRVREHYQMTVIFVTHDIEEAVLLGDRVALMGGRPPGIREIIDVPLGRPRQALDVDTSEFLAVKRTIRASLGVLSVAHWSTLPVAVEERAVEERAAADSVDDQFELAAHRLARRKARSRRVMVGAIGIVVLLAAWEIAAVILDDAVVLPSVTQTVHAFVFYFGRPYPSAAKPLWYDLVVSLRRILLGFVLGVLGGVALGAAMSANRFVRHLIDPVIEVVRPLPPLAFIPPLIVWFGIGELPKEVLITGGIIPIMTIATVAALDEVPEDLLLAARTLGASRRYTLLHIQLRSALPGILIGMRISMAGAWTSIVAAEMLAATSGVGYLISQAGDYLNMSIVFAGIITIAVAGLLLDACLRGLLLFADPSRRS
ncbi:MAG: ABC transporter permease subunit [Streptosporangiaceae bacterium]|nr:ABC transporter permease subunit [Streptosporangiaceae bacterium]